MKCPMELEQIKVDSMEVHIDNLKEIQSGLNEQLGEAKCAIQNVHT